ncbi:MAG: hypothetical protein JO164_11305 [Candidatus Eremiobacteraeota bacterium]|nr:hypothetical protein [Candidatus Eremiobacteraeota bacterium]
MTGARYARALWPVLFLVPLTWWADRGCSIVGIDPLYHATVWLHERLGWFLAVLAAVSAGVVATKIAVARRRFVALRALAEPLPARVMRAVARASSDLRVRAPNVLYLGVSTPIASAVVGRTVLLSRGFVDVLGDDDLELVVRHEFAHVRRHDVLAGVIWHLAFAALLVPGFEPLERHLHRRRERAANVIAAEGREELYLTLLGALAAGGNLCADARLGLEATPRAPADRWTIWYAPLAVVLLAVAFPLSHAAFRHDLTYLLTHHC